MQILKLTLLVFYLLLMVYLLFFLPNRGTPLTDGQRVEIIPFKTTYQLMYKSICVTQYRDQSIRNAARHILGNLCLFVLPIILLLSLRSVEVNFSIVVISVLLTSLFIECVQLVSRSGIFDIDDIIWNTMGSLLGIFLYRLGRENKNKKVLNSG